MNYESFERKSWNQDINHEYYKIFEFNEIKYEIDKNQRINQKYINKQDNIRYINISRIYI